MPDNKAALREQGGGVGYEAAGYRSHVHYSTSAGPAHGEVRGDVWRKAVRASVHQLRTPRAWALDAADLCAAERRGVAVVDILDLEGPTHWYATPGTIRRRGFRLDRGHGAQWALALEHWRPTRSEAEASEPALQLALFGGAV